MFVCVAARRKNVGKNMRGFKKRLRVYIQNVPVYAGTTRTCFATCASVAGIHWDVLSVHTEAFLNPHTGNRTNQTKSVRTALHHPWNQERAVNLTTSLLVFSSSSLLFFFSSSRVKRIQLRPT